MPLLVRNVLAGLAAGLILSSARAPLGMDLASVPAAPALTAALFRALALLAVGIGLGPRMRVPTLLAGTALGFGVHGFFLAPWLEVGGWFTLAVALVAGALAMTLAAPRPAEDDAPPAAGSIERLGLAVAGAGSAVALESIARQLRLLGSTHTYDDTSYGFVLLVALTLGAAAFGGLVSREKWSRAGLGAGLALGTALCLYSVQLLGEFSSREGLDRFLRSPPWELDLSQRGRLLGNWLIAGRVLLVPAFALGTALCGARHRSQLASVLAGAGVGLVLLPLALIDGSPSTEVELSLEAAGRVTIGALTAAAGGLIALLGARDRLARPALALGLVGCAAAGAGALFGPKARALPISPWERFPITTEWIADTPEGLMTVELQQGGGRLVTLDRRRLTPVLGEHAADAQRLALALALLPPEEQGGARVLLVGQLTPERAQVLGQLKVARVDRTARWHEVMPAIETQLFGADALPAGDVIAPDTAADRMRSGAYDLVVVPPVSGPPPRVPLPDPLPETDARVVVWLRSDEATARRDWSEAVLLSSHGVDFLTIGVHDGSEGAPAGSAASPATPWWRVRAWPFDRESHDRRAAAERLARAGVGTPAEALGRGLALHAGSQRRSSPWETVAQQTEISAESLELLRRAALEPGADPLIAIYLTELWERLAEVLAEKREIDLIYDHVEPLAEALAPWPALERVLAYADLEMLDPERAAERLKAVVERQPFDLAARLTRAQALNMADDPAAAAEELRAVLAVQPDRHDVRRRLAVSLVRAGDPAGVPLVEELLLEDPDDEELRRYLGHGPFPPLPIEFMTGAARHEH